MKPARAVCPDCQTERAVRLDGQFRAHGCHKLAARTGAPDVAPSASVAAGTVVGGGEGEAPTPTPARALPRALVDLYAVDALRPRSVQQEIGVSALGGCRRAAAETILRTPETNQTDRLGAVEGTAIHGALEYAARQRNPFALVEHPVRLDDFDLLGHVDYFDPLEGVVEDWKTVGSVSPGHKPKRQQKWQVQVYAKALADAGHAVKGVRLVFIPRDGSGRDAVVWEDDYREDVAMEALLWLEGVRDVIGNGHKPDPERVASSWCRDWCPFYDPAGLGSGCAGLVDKPADVVLDDPDVLAAAAAYAQAQADAKTAAQVKDAARDTLVGIAGRAGDVVVSWSDPKPREVLDEELVRAAYESAGVPVPTRVETSSARLSVRTVKQ